MITEKFALVSTVDSMGSEFPGHCVITFDTERDAILYAAKTIVKFDKTTAYVESEENWLIGEEDHYDDPVDFLEAWQDGLDATEYFHVMPVREALK